MERRSFLVGPAVTETVEPEGLEFLHYQLCRNESKALPQVYLPSGDVLGEVPNDRGWG